MGWSRFLIATSGCEMSREIRASTWSGLLSSASRASPSGHASLRLRHSRRICAHHIADSEEAADAAGEKHVNTVTHALISATISLEVRLAAAHQHEASWVCMQC